jgi:hypothetical protein
MASVSVIGGRLRLCARQSVTPLARTAAMSAHHLVVLVVDARHEPVRRERGEASVEGVRRDAWETARVGAERGELKGRRPRRDEIPDPGGSFDRVHGGVEREVHPRPFSGLGGLPGEPFGRRDQGAVVVGHVHDRGHAAGRG